MTGRAGASAPAISSDRVNAVLERCLHQRKSGVCFDFPFLTAWIDEYDPDHASAFGGEIAVEAVVKVAQPSLLPVEEHPLEALRVHTLPRAGASPRSETQFGAQGLARTCARPEVGRLGIPLVQDHCRGKATSRELFSPCDWPSSLPLHRRGDDGD